MRVHDDFVAVKVPATSANLGPGFDCMGLALDLWDEVSILRDDGGDLGRRRRRGGRQHRTSVRITWSFAPCAWPWTMRALPRWGCVCAA